MRSSPSQFGPKTYRLIGRIFDSGLTVETASELQALPQTAITLPKTLSIDELAADHQTLFGFNVFPFQSFFLDESGLLGGTQTEQVQRSYQRAGITPDTGRDDHVESPDHIAQELTFLALLLQDESRAREAGTNPEIQKLRRWQAEFLRQHLLRWVSPFVIAITTQPYPFYAALAEWMLRLLFSHASDLGDAGVADAVWMRETKPDLTILEAEGTGLPEIASHLLLPIHSGIYLSKQDITRLARQLGLPRGFGDRRQMLLNLMRAAVTYDRLPELIESLTTLVGYWLDSYTRHASTCSAAASVAEGWRARASGTAELLDQIARSARQAPV